ncbi:MAG: elongation factor G-like protein EF-G2, partial [Actinomycetota bacterium]|nr:elongation factor G-like protein EF-G2 [Actinomycetota bacterium]
LFGHAVITRAGSVESGTTVSDHDESEHKQQRSVSLSLVPYVVAGIKVNLLDTPGYADYVGELRAGLRAADCALFVVSAAEPLDGATKALWYECESVGMPRAVAITKLDHPRADYDATLDAVQNEFGVKVMPLYLPMSDGTALAGLLSQQVFDFSAGDRKQREPDGDEAAAITNARGALIEAVIEESEDESLMDRYLSGEDIDLDTLVDDLETAVARGTFFPLIPLAATTGVGLAELDEIITRGFPAPVEHPVPAVFTIAGAAVDPLPCDPDGPLLAEVVKTTSDPYLGRVSMVRIFSGTLHPDAVVHVSGHSSAFGNGVSGHVDHDEDERVGGLSSPLGKTMRSLQKAVAGDVCAIAKLSRAETGDTISGKDRPLLMEPWSMPEPLLPVAVEAQTKSDEDKLSQGLARLAAEDSTLLIEHNPETHQLVLWTMGESHAEVLLDRLEARYGVSVRRVEVMVPLRETLAGPASGHGRHVKQSGGHGQYAVCNITVEPLPSGSGFEFVDKVVGGAVPRQFIPSVEKGVLAQMERGVATGNRVVDIRVTLTDGKAHSVDSSDMAFQTAGALALKDAAERGGVSLLEPVYDVRVLIADDFVGAVMGDLSSRRARVLGSESMPGGRTVVHAEAPATELLRYATELRSMSHGTGSFSRTFARYDPVPAHITARWRDT